MVPDVSARHPFREADLLQYVAHGYDLISETYDLVEAQNAVGQRLRTRFQSVLLSSFQPGDRILEIGCGTGIEALALSQQGVEVVATDISSEMVSRTRKRAEEAGARSLDVRHLGAHEIGSLVTEFGRGNFDGAYSHAGALNMDPHLSDTAKALSELLRVSAAFLCTVINQTSLFEVLFYPLVLRPRKAFRRLGNIIPIPITRATEYKDYVVPTRFYTPKQFREYFAPTFAMRRLSGMQILLPPWNLADHLEKIGPMVQGVESLEDLLSTTPPFSSWGSLFLMELIRIEDG